MGSQMKVAIFIVNYNMPERADDLYKHLVAESDQADIYLIDNGSDMEDPADNTNVYLDVNVQTTNGWLNAIDTVDPSGLYEYYGFVITSAEFVPQTGKTIDPILHFMDRSPNTVGCHVALTPDSTTNWDHLLIRDPGEGEFIRTWMIDDIYSIYRTDWFRGIGMFDPRLSYAWGIDLETSYLARKQGKELYVYNGTAIRKITNIGYDMDRMNMTSYEREMNARNEMDRVLGEKYGENYFYRMTNEYVTEEMR